MKKYTIIVVVLFVYSLIMTIWGYRNGTVTTLEAILGLGGMTVVLVILWFVYRKKQQYRDKRKELK